MKIRDINKLLILSASLALPAKATDVLPIDPPGCGMTPVSCGMKEGALVSCLESLMERLLAQHNINAELVKAARRGDKLIVQNLLDLPFDDLRPTAYGIDLAYIAAVLNNHRDVSRILPKSRLPLDIDSLSRTAVMIYDYQAIELLLAFSRGDSTFVRENFIFYCAAETNRPNIVGWMLFSAQTLPDFNGMFRAVRAAVQNDNQEVVVKVLGGVSGATRQDFMLGFLIRSGQQENVEWFLGLPAVHQRGQDVINYAFYEAALFGHQGIMEWLLNRPEGQRPNHDGINRAFISKARSHVLMPDAHQATLEWLLNRPEGQRPTIRAIITAYRNARANGNAAIVRLLHPIVPDEERLDDHGIDHLVDVHGGFARAGGRIGRGLAFEVHRFTESLVTVPISASVGCEGDASEESPRVATTTPRQVRLIDAVQAAITSRLTGIPLVSYDEAQGTIQGAVRAFIPEDQQAEAMEAVGHRLGSDTGYERLLSLAVSFIQKFHLGGLQQWTEGFVRESMEAYRGRINPTSCTKGIGERVFLGFRGMDHELDGLFAQPEGSVMMNMWLKTWNVEDAGDEAKRRLAQQLMASGVTAESTAADAANAFREIAIAKLTEHGLQDSPELKVSIETYAGGMVETHYDADLKPHIVS